MKIVGYIGYFYGWLLGKYRNFKSDQKLKRIERGESPKFNWKNILLGSLAIVSVAYAINRFLGKRD